MKSLISRRRTAGAICPRCKSPDYALDLSSAITKPGFICNSCKTTWNFGYDGGHFADFLEHTEFIDLLHWERTNKLRRDL